MKRILRGAVVLAFGLLACGSAEAAFKLCNHKATSVSVAVGFLDGARGWTAQGWWTVNRGDCATLVDGRLTSSYVYLLVDGGGLPPARNQSGGWFCTADQGFRIRNDDYADKQHQLLCEVAGLHLEQFREIAVRGSNATMNLK
jgi:uncharacterized membrane protein